jgi:DNA-binding CsgD family transcriptional regulator/pimeloyl-ACP methyl ester carboxylesterase
MDAPPVRYTTTTDGYDIAYMVSGQGRPLVLMPASQNHIGHYWQSSAMRPGFEELAARFRLIQYDCRGQGLSSRGLRAGLTPQDWVSDLVAIVDQEGLEHFVLVDQHSRGFVSSLYTLAHSDRVDALVLINIALAHSTLPPAIDNVIQEDWDFSLRALGPMVLPWEEPTRAREIIRDIWTAPDVTTMRQSVRDVRTEEAWPRIGVPTLVLGSREGSYTFATESDSRRLTALIPGAHLIVLDEPGCGLYGYGDEPPVPQIIEHFLDGLESKEEQDHGPPEPSTGLSPRELEVLRLVAQGLSNLQVAAELVISPSTVAKHVNSILTKTESRNRAGAASYAHRHGLI